MPSSAEPPVRESTTLEAMRPKLAAGIGVGLAIAIGVVAIGKWRTVRAPKDASESTIAVRITKRDATGLPSKKSVIREPARVRAIVEALGVDGHPIGKCPPDYAEAPLGIVLSGADVYSRRNVYVFGGGPVNSLSPVKVDADDSGANSLSPVKVDAGVGMSVVTVTSAGCRVGAPADPAALAREIEGAKAVTE